MDRLSKLSDFNRMKRSVGHIIDVVAAVALISMTVHVVANALLRSLASRPIQNTLEYVQYWYLPLIAILGFVSAQLRGRHIVADLIYQALPTSLKRGVSIATQSACAIVMAGFAWGTWHYALHSLQIGRTAGLTDIPTWPVHFLFPVAFLILSIDFMAEAIGKLRGSSENGQSNEEYDMTLLSVVESRPGENESGRRK